ncbi:hypothetical protein JKP88DRAFT_268431 [Tribonema minus]|uniref:G-protein coupled receptors family 2 profile 2 domain-containing protein n=1 Tax=Tribonema minus TaxID=303371 RepID=A0A835Z4Y8_9STRA|nr:hypothetical protein JKP88DRAFT_268431 [Tribonema minus]
MQPLLWVLLLCCVGRAVAFTTQQNDILVLMAKLCASISFVGSSSVVLSYVLFARLRTFSFHLVLMMAIADIGSDITYWMGNPEDGSPLCMVQAMMQNFCQLSVMLWTSCMAYTLLSVAVHEKVTEPAEQKRMLIIYHCYVWGVAGTLMLLPLTTDAYGSTGSWCWITVDQVGWRYGAFYGILWLIIAGEIVAYVQVYRRVHQMVARMEAAGAQQGSSVRRRQARVRRFLRSLAMYPAILIFCWTTPSINRIQNIIDPDNPIYPLLLTQVITVRLQGLLNAIAYGFTDAVQGAWHDAGCACCREDLDAALLLSSRRSSIDNSAAAKARASLMLKFMYLRVLPNGLRGRAAVVVAPLEHRQFRCRQGARVAYDDELRGTTDLDAAPPSSSRRSSIDNSAAAKARASLMMMSSAARREEFGGSSRRSSAEPGLYATSARGSASGPAAMSKGQAALMLGSSASDGCVAAAVEVAVASRLCEHCALSGGVVAADDGVLRCARGRPRCSALRLGRCCGRVAADAAARNEFPRYAGYAGATDAAPRTQASAADQQPVHLAGVRHRLCRLHASAGGRQRQQPGGGSSARSPGGGRTHRRSRRRGAGGGSGGRRGHGDSGALSTARGAAGVAAARNHVSEHCASRRRKAAGRRRRPVGGVTRDARALPPPLLLRRRRRRVRHGGGAAATTPRHLARGGNTPRRRCARRCKFRSHDARARALLLLLLQRTLPFAPGWR